jgi:L,D-transpeptidase catalytic domain
MLRRAFRPALPPRLWLLAAGVAAGLLLSASAANAATNCRRGKATGSMVGGIAAKVSWRAELLSPTGVYRRIPPRAGIDHRTIGPRQAPWLLVLRAAQDRRGRCWVKVRLPWRPNRAAGWISAEQLALAPTSWRIAISRRRRTLTVYRGGVAVKRVKVVVGAPSTPSPRGLFSIVGAWRSPPSAFVGSWIFGLTAHSRVLREFDGGEGRVGIHGRGGASLGDPLGTARSHGCIRLSNRSIDWIARAIGPAHLPGIPVAVR